jgi:hypothetical protein
MGPYPVLILVGEPNQANSLELGSLTPVLPHLIIYEIRLNGGELGTPGVEITITTPAMTAAAPAITVTLWYEPGVRAGTTATSHEERYHLTRFSAEWLGKSGGGGHMYDHDPDVIGSSTIAIKKQTLRMKITTHGYVSSDPVALRQLRQRFSTPGNPHGRLLAMLTSSSFTAKLYLTVPDAAAIQPFNDDVLSHLQRAHLYRLPPYHQYTMPNNVIGLEMERLPRFRRHMMCDRTLHGATLAYSAPRKVIADTLGRKDVRVVNMVHRVGICREEQAHDMFCVELEKASVLLKLVRTRAPLLNKATRDTLANNVYGQAAEPVDQYVYVGFCKIVSGKPQAPAQIPRPGTLGFVSWIRRDSGGWTTTGEQAFGMVLAPHPQHTMRRADFAMALYIRDQAIRQRASPDPAAALPQAIRLKYIRNRQPGQEQFTAIERLGSFTSMNPVLINLRTLMIHQEIQVRAWRDISSGPDGLHPPAACTTAKGWFATSSLLSKITRAEIDVLNLSTNIDGYVHRVRTTVGGGSARSVYALMCILMLVGYRLVVIIEEPTARSEFLYGLNMFLQAVQVNSMSLNRPNLRSKRVLSHSVVDVEVAEVANAASTDLSSPVNPLRRKLRLVFNCMLGGLAEEAVLYDTGAFYSSPAPQPPANCTPQGWSMADRVADYLLRNAGLRPQYYADRARVLNPGQIPEQELVAIEARIRGVHRAVFAEQDVLACDHNTAMSGDIATNFARHIMIFGNTHRTPFSKVAAVITHHLSLRAAILLGNPADQRFGPTQLASRGRNEALTTFGRSAWEVLERGGGSLCTNVV